MRYGSVCSGIEAATVAWHPLGWTAAFFSEIEAFPRAVLEHRWPEVPLHGDFTTIQGDEYGPIDLLAGGTPCQSFSIAGLRGGLADERGNLALEFLRLAQRTRPRWIVWENVPGVLSSNGGRDFGAILGGMAELRYGWAYRVLDAQYVRVDGFGRAVPQRRRRVFVVGYLGDWRRAAAVLFERQGLRRDPAPRRAAKEIVAGSLSASAGRRCGVDDPERGKLIAFGGNNTSGSIEVATALNAHGGPMGRMDFESETFVAHALRAEGFDASEDGSGRGTPLVPICFDARQRDVLQYGSVAGSLDTDGHTMAIASTLSAVEVADALTVGANQTTGFHSEAVSHALSVRRLTPRECERLQGFPDDYTFVPVPKLNRHGTVTRRPFAKDGPRYKALGNSMAVNVMRWIGRRIEMVERLAVASKLEAAE